jgi:hypothetical protein
LGRRTIGDITGSTSAATNGDVSGTNTSNFTPTFNPALRASRAQ